MSVKSFFHTHWPPLLLTLVWILPAFLIGLQGEFPLNDDWSWSTSVRILVEGGHLHFTDWSSSPLIVQILWGALFSLPFGFSFTALRISGFVMGYGGMMGTWLLLREMDAGRFLSFLGALVIAFNPVYFVLSYSFMTDIPFYTFFIFSMYCILRGLKQGRYTWQAAGFVFMILAGMIRYIGAVVIIAYAAAYLYKNGLNRRSLIRALAPVGLTLVLFLVYPVILDWTVGLPKLYHHYNTKVLESLSSGPRAVFHAVWNNSLTAFVYLGLFLLPFTSALSFSLSDLPAGVRKAVRSTAIGLPLIFLCLFFYFKNYMPLTSNILYDFGLGPLLLKDQLISREPAMQASQAVWAIITVFSVFGGILLLNLILRYLYLVIRKWKKERLDVSAWTKTFCFSAVLIYFSPLSLVGFFDRYLLPLIPLLMAFSVQRLESNRFAGRRWQKTAGFVFLSVFIWFSVAGTRDYLQWNRLRWKAIGYLTDELHVPPDEIDGGFEFNGYYLFSFPYERTNGRSWWWVRGDRFAVTFRHIPGYTAIRTYTYDPWLPKGAGTIHVLKKTGANASPVEQCMEK